MFNGGGPGAGIQQWQPGGFDGGKGKGDNRRRSAWFNEFNICDLTEDQWDAHGQRVPFADREEGKVEIVACGSNIVGLKEAMKMQRATAIFVRSCDDWEENVDRCQRLARIIDLSQLTDEKFDTFFDGIRRLNVSLQVRPVPLEEYCKKKVKTAQLDPNDFLA